MSLLRRGTFCSLLLLTFYLSYQVVHPNIRLSSVDPIKGDYGDTIKVKGNGVTAGVDINLYWDKVGAWADGNGLLNSTAAEADGSFEIWFDVPESLNGEHYLWAKDTDTGDTVMYFVPFIVFSSIRLSRSSSIPGYSIQLNGYGFSDEVEVTTFLSDIPPPFLSLLFLNTTETDKVGSFSFTFNVPNEDEGNYFIYAEDENGINATSVFKIRSQITIYDFSIFYSHNPNTIMIYPSDSPDKPLGCWGAWVSDWLASAFVYTKLEFITEGLDTNPDFVDQLIGRAVGDSGSGIISFGGQFVNPVVKYAEIDGTPWEDRAPIKFYLDDGIFRFQYKNGSNIPVAWLPQSVINEDEDMFVIETFMDGEGRYMMICYGFGWKGTYAAGKFFDRVIYPSLISYPYNWIIVKWNDTNEDGFINGPDDGDTYTIISQGYLSD